MAQAVLRGPRVVRACAVLMAFVLGACLLTQAAFGAATIEEQRAAFLAAYATAQMGDASWRAQAQDLRGYPLYPWLEAAQLEHDLAQASEAEIGAYLKRYHGLVPAEDLRRNTLELLARRRSWKPYLRFYRAGFGDDLACYALQARLAQGERLNFKRDLAVLWREPSLPKSCDKVQRWAHDHGLLTSKRLWERIDSAAGEERADTIAWLARWLPEAQAVVARRYVAALRRPRHTVQAALHWQDSGRNREAALLAITELAGRASDRAARAWPRLDRHFDFSEHARNRILRAIALARAYGFQDDALEWLAALPDAAETEATRAWRVRVAIAKRDWPAALGALNALDAEQSRSDSWRYLRARVLQKLGQDKKARALFVALSGESDYWGFLAADRLGKPYVICPHAADYSLAQEQALLAHPDFARAFELFAVGMLRDARRVWARAIKGEDATTRNLAADLAFRRGWYSRAIFTYSYGDLLQRYERRFPLAHRDAVKQAASASGVEAAWIYATIRAESAWITDAGSGAGALGLMQLMPGTARLEARRRDVSAQGFSYDPDVNIALGVYYLERLGERYDGRLWLASIAYNAGPGRADDWLEERGALAPDLFIATIPFGQTRNYVVSVLAYSVIYDWRLNGKPTRIVWRLRGKVGTEGERERAAVVCPTAVSSTAAAVDASR